MYSKYPAKHLPVQSDNRIETLEKDVKYGSSEDTSEDTRTTF